MTAPDNETAGSFYFEGIQLLEGPHYDLAVHSCHFPQATAIITSPNDAQYDAKGLKAKFSAPKNQKPHQIFPPNSRHLLFFGAASSEAMTPPSRYGPVVMSLKLNNLISGYTAQYGMPQLFILGTSKYKKEYSHKILVSAWKDPLFQKLALLPPECPMFTWRDWILSPTPREPGQAEFEQWEFVLDLGPTEGPPNPSLELSVSLSFAAHNVLCVPSITATPGAIECSSNFEWPNGVKTSLTGDRTRSAKESMLEFCFYLLNQNKHVSLAFELSEDEELATELEELSERRTKKGESVLPRYRQRDASYKSCLVWREENIKKRTVLGWLVQRREK